MNGVAPWFSWMPDEGKALLAFAVPRRGETFVDAAARSVARRIGGKIESLEHDYNYPSPWRSYRLLVQTRAGMVAGRLHIVS